MEALIKEKLLEIEQRESGRILLAVESGSRAWGFASPDSDYDVRFIYVRDKDSYLKLNRSRDVIELPINDVLDINGWDVDKTLKLLHNSNPTVFEWFSSPIIYKTTPFAEQFKPIMQHYFSSKSGLWHYLHMAEGNYREYLKVDLVKAKKYFYGNDVMAMGFKGKQIGLALQSCLDAVLEERIPNERGPLLSYAQEHNAD